MNIKTAAAEIIDGRRLKREEDLSFFETADLSELCECANEIRKKLCGNDADLCSIVNARSGHCGENCKFCAQSALCKSDAEEYGFLDGDTIAAECERNAKNGVNRFSLVTSGRTLAGEDFQKALAVFRRLRGEYGNIELCGSFGLLSTEQFKELRDAGMKRFHCNLETSEEYFPKICTTHTYAEKIANIKRAQSAGLEVCSGGIIGMGESFADRVSLAMTTAELGIRSVPINILIPIKGTPFGNLKRLGDTEILRAVAVFRFINPTAVVRLAGGRILMKNSGKQAFLSGANAAITGDMLTTVGNGTAMDRKMLAEMDFCIKDI